MDFVVALKDDLRLLDKTEAEQRFLEFLSMGYQEEDIILARTVPVRVNLQIETTEVAYPNANFTNSNLYETQTQIQVPNENPS